MGVPSSKYRPVSLQNESHNLMGELSLSKKTALWCQAVDLTRADVEFHVGYRDNCIYIPQRTDQNTYEVHIHIASHTSTIFKFETPYIPFMI